MENEVVSKNFIEVEIEKDLAEGVYDTVHTRFPPEPNGCLTIDLRDDITWLNTCCDRRRIQ